MGFNLSSLIKDKTKIDPLFAIIFGASGAGKSTAVGTLGVKTLVIHGPTENHSGTAATLKGGNNITSLEYTARTSSGEIDHDASFVQLLNVLRSPELKEFECVALDSWTELQSVIEETQDFQKSLINDKGIKNKFNESGEYMRRLTSVVHELLNLKSSGVHVITTCAATIKETEADGSDTSATPSLKGYKVAEDLVRNFPDVFYVQLIINDEGKSEHRFLFNPRISKESTDKGGKTTKMSFSNFAPRVSHFGRDELPEQISVDMAKLVARREAQFNKRLAAK